MNIIVDAMGGDFAPLEPVKGACQARDELGINITLVGCEEKIREIALENSLSLENIEIVNTTEVVEMDDHPLAVRDKLDSSMRVAFKMLKHGEGDALVSAGNTGALHAGSTLIVHRVRGVLRSAIATILPLEKPVLLIDSGANTTVTEEHLVQFAVMGSLYMEKVFNIERPKVGLVNIGSEEIKGTPLHVETYKRLKACEEINFYGNIEGKEIPFGVCDVIVCDGFTGNIILKMTEGMGSFMMENLTSVFTYSASTKAAYLMCKKPLRQLKRKFDASEYGGAPFLGISRPVIKAHGSSNARAIKNAIKQAVVYYNTGLISDIAAKYTPPKQTEGETPASEQ